MKKNVNVDDLEFIEPLSDKFDVLDGKESKTCEQLNQDLVATLSKYWKCAKVEPLRDDKNARVTCILINKDLTHPVAQLDFVAPIDKLHEVFSWNNENLRKFIQEFI